MQRSNFLYRFSRFSIDTPRLSESEPEQMRLWSFVWRLCVALFNAGILLTLILVLGAGIGFVLGVGVGMCTLPFYLGGGGSLLNEGSMTIWEYVQLLGALGWGVTFILAAFISFIYLADVRERWHGQHSGETPWWDPVINFTNEK